MTINSVSELKEERARLKQRREALEKDISGNWSDLKEGLRPVNIIKDTVRSIINHKADETRDKNKDSVLKSTLSLIATELADVAASKATELFNNLFKKKKKKNKSAPIVEAEAVEID